MAELIMQQETGTPSTPSSGKRKWFPKSDGWYSKDDAGVVEGPFHTVAPGIIQMYGGSSAPTGFLFCDGSAVSRTTYAALFAIIGTTYGAGDGSTTFNVPDMRGRVPIGVGTGTGGGASGSGLPAGGSALTARARGDWLGEQTHVLTIAELAAHAHDVLSRATAAAFGTNARAAKPSATGTADTITNGASSVGSDTAHNNIQPVMTVNFIIKT